MISENENNLIENIEQDDLLNSSNSSIINEKNIKDEYKLLLISIIKRYNKNRYKEIFNEIEKKKNIYLNLDFSNNFIFTHFQFRCLFKIIERKFIKYYYENKIKGIDNCLKLTNKLLDSFSEKIKFLPIESQKQQYEYLNYFHLMNLYYNALLKKHENNIIECLSYLSLAEKIIKKTSQNITYSKIWRIIVKIYLFITSLLIMKKDFLSAKNYIFIILEICFKDLDFTIYSNQICLNKNENKEIKEIFFNLLISFYQLGCINENLNNFENAESSFQQANYICIYLLNNKYPEISSFINNIFQRIKSNFFTFKLICDINIDINNFIKKKIKNYKTIYTIGEEKKKKYYEKIENYIEKIKLTEIDDDHYNLLTEPKRVKSEKIEKMVKNLHLLNYLTSQNFKSTITNLKSININKFDNDDTKRIIQKKIMSIKNEETLKNISLNNKKLKFKNDKKLKINFEKSYDLLSEKIKSKRSNSNSSTHFKTINLSSKKINMKYNSIYTNPVINKNSSEKPFKIDYDKYILNQNYINKNKYLENQIIKEYKFHKDILNNKKYEKILIEPFNLKKIKNESDLFYNIELDKIMKRLKEKNKSSKEKNKENNSIIQKIKYILKEKSCKSLNFKEHNKYKEFVKRFANRESKVQSEKLLKLYSIDKYNDNIIDNLNIINEAFISKIAHDVHNLEKKEFLLQKHKIRVKSK